MSVEVMIKPDYIEWEVIRRIVDSSYSIHKDFCLNSASLNAEEMKKRIGDGICFIAKDGSIVVGTISIRYVNRKNWYASGRIPDIIFYSVLPEYQGQGISSLLLDAAINYIKINSYNIVELDTAEKNRQAINVYVHQGFMPVRYFAPKNADHYSIVMVKWLSKCPYSRLKIYFKCMLSEIYVKSVYKIGGKKRFGNKQ